MVEVLVSLSLAAVQSALLMMVGLFFAVSLAVWRRTRSLGVARIAATMGVGLLALLVWVLTSWRLRFLPAGEGDAAAFAVWCCSSAVLLAAAVLSCIEGWVLMARGGRFLSGLDDYLRQEGSR